MDKKILVLNGSPRVNGNTETLIDAFIKGAQEAGNTVDRCNIRQMNIHPCIGCLCGGKNLQSPCVQKDDMDRIYPLFEAADIVLFASPLYFWGFSAQLKMVIDRLFAPMEATGYQETPVKNCMLMIAAEEEGEKNFSPIIHYYESYIENMKWNDVGQLLVGGVMQKGDINNKPDDILKAYKLGLSL